MSENEKDLESIDEITSVEEAPTEEAVPQVEAAPAEEAPVSEGTVPTESATLEEVVPEAESEQAPACKSCGKKTSRFGAFFYFAVTLAVFIAYEVFCAVNLYAPAASAGSLKEGIQSVFGYLFGFFVTIFFGLIQLPENVISNILFKRLKKEAETDGERTLFTVFRALTLAMFFITLISLLLYIAVIVLGAFMG